MCIQGGTLTKRGALCLLSFPGTLAIWLWVSAGVRLFGQRVYALDPPHPAALALVELSLGLFVLFARARVTAAWTIVGWAGLGAAAGVLRPDLMRCAAGGGLGTLHGHVWVASCSTLVTSGLACALLDRLMRRAGVATGSRE